MSSMRRLQLDPHLMFDMLRKKGFFENEAVDKDDYVYTGNMSDNWLKVRLILLDIKVLKLRWIIP